MPLFESAAKEAADVVTAPRESNEPVQPIQVTLKSQSNPAKLRELGASHVSKLVKVQGIIISASSTKAKATEIAIQCQSCRQSKRMPVNAGFGGAILPRVCDRTPVSDEEQKCGIDPFVILPDKSTCIDQQTLKMQELVSFLVSYACGLY